MADFSSFQSAPMLSSGPRSDDVELGDVQAPQAPARTVVAYTTHVPPVPANVEQLRETLRNRRVDFSCEKYLSEGWRFYRLNACEFFKLALILILQVVLLSLITLLIARGLAGDSNNDENDGGNGEDSIVHLFHRRHYHKTDESNNSTESDSDDKKHSAIGGIWCFLTVLEGVLIYMPMVSGLWYTVFTAMRLNAKICWKHVYSAFTCDYYFKLLPLMIILSVLNFVLWHLFVVPGIWFYTITIFAIPLHREHKTRTFQAICISHRVVRRYCCAMFAFLLMLTVINFMGACLMGLGLFVTIPVTFAALCYCYHHLIGVNGVPVVTVEQQNVDGPAPAPVSVAAPAPVSVAAAPRPQSLHVAIPIISSPSGAPAPAPVSAAPGGAPLYATIAVPVHSEQPENFYRPAPQQQQQPPQLAIPYASYAQHAQHAQSSSVYPSLGSSSSSQQAPAFPVAVAYPASAPWNAQRSIN